MPRKQGMNDTIVCAVVYYAWAAHAFSAEIKCQHCSFAVIMVIVFQHGDFVMTPLSHADCVVKY